MTIRSIYNILIVLSIVLIGFASNLARAADSLQARVIWLEDGQIYFNAGEKDAIGQGWSYRLILQPGDTVAYPGIINQVYPAISSAPAGQIPELTPAELIDLPLAWLFPPADTRANLGYLRVGCVGYSDLVNPLREIVNRPFLSSVFYPFARSGDLGRIWPDSGYGCLQTDDGRHWQFMPDSTVWPGGEFPATSGALADRLEQMLTHNNDRNCPTFWALRPSANDPLGPAGVKFEGFSPMGDSALVLEYATSFHSLPEYFISGEWRRALVGASDYDAKPNQRSRYWFRSEDRVWRPAASPPAIFPFLLDSISVVPFENHPDQWLAFELGQLDLGLLSIEDMLRTTMYNLQFNFVSSVQNELIVFGANQQKTDLADNRLTTAVSYLVDKYSLVQVLLADQGEVADQIFPPLGEADAEAFYPFDPYRGQRIMRDIEIDRPLRFYVDTRIDRGMTVARHLAGKLYENGVRTELIPADREKFAAAGDQLDLFLYAWPVDAAAPDRTLYPFLYYPGRACGSNPLGVDEPRFLNLLEKARREPDGEARARYYREIEYVLLAEPYLCPLYRPVKTIAVSKRLPDLRLTPCGEIDIVPGGK